MTVAPMFVGTSDSSNSPPETPPSQPINFNGLKGKKEADRLVQWATSQYQRIKSARSGQIERQWYLNMAFYAGQQNIAVIPVKGSVGGFRFLEPPAPYWRARPVINKIRPIIRTELSKLTSQKPSASIVPASSEDKDLFAAYAGEQLWESLYQRLKIQQEFSDAMWWTSITGTGFMKSYWDPSVTDASGNQGDFCVRAETPFHIFIPDFREKELERQPFLIHASTKSVDWVKLHYKKALDGKDIAPNARTTDNDILQEAFLNIVGAGELKNNSVLILECWVKPGMMSQYPNGAMFTVLGDQLVQATEGWPYIHNQYPFIKFENIPTGRFYGESVVTDLIPLQKEYNRTRGQIIEAKNRMAKPQLIAPVGSVNPAQITTEPGQVIFYKQGFAPPQPLPLQPLPNYVSEELMRIQGDMDDISGQHEVSKGNVPPGVTAATAISYLQEQDDTKLSHAVNCVESGMEKLASQCLSYVVQFWDAERMVKITGTDGAFDTLMLKGADLASNTDVRVEAGSALPTSKAAKQAFIMDLMKMGFIDPQKGLEVMEIGGVQKIYDDIQVDVRQAQRENLKMQAITPDLIQQNLIAGQQMQQQDPQSAVDPNTGQPVMPPPIVPVNSWDNHMVHIETHNKFRKSQAFELLPDILKLVFEEHVNSHISAMQSGIVDPSNAPQPPNSSGSPSGDPGAVSMPPDPGNPAPPDPTLGAPPSG